MVNEIGKALEERYAGLLRTKNLEEYVKSVFSRMINPYFNDTIERGIRTSITKISGSDARLIRSARFSIESEWSK